MEDNPENITEKNYYLHLFPYKGALASLGKEIYSIEKSGKKTLWYYSGKSTLDKLEKGKKLMEKGVKGGLYLTPHDVNNIIYVLIKRLNGEA